MNREQRRRIARLIRRVEEQRHRPKVVRVSAAFVDTLDVAWVEGKEGIEGWAMCAWCGLRTIHIIKAEDGDREDAA